MKNPAKSADLEGIHFIVTFEVLNRGQVEAPVHFIVGTGFRRRAVLAGRSDGVVEYWSSHLDYAESETAVPTRHSLAPHHPETAAELRRILRLHLGSLR